MSELSIKDLENKIAQINKDLIRLTSEPGNDRKISVLREYKEYLEDEIKFLKNENRS